MLGPHLTHMMRLVKYPVSGPSGHFECGWANTSDVFEEKNLKGPLFSNFQKSGWAHLPTRALSCFKK